MSKIHSSLRPSNLQLQNDTAMISCRIRAVEHRKCVAGPADAHPGLQDWILQNYSRIENAHEVRKTTFNFLLCIEVQQMFSFHFSYWDIINFLNASMSKKALFELVQQFYHATELKKCSHCDQRLPWSALADKIKTIASDKWTIAEHNLKHA